jgi:N-methylhydantoinase B
MTVDPFTLEVIRNRLDVIAEEMQLSLLRSAYSTIIKEALDASCAIFDKTGEQLAQATASPIHLGSLIPVVQRILKEFPVSEMMAGDVYLMNDPYDGGTHLPDIGVVVPVTVDGEVVALGASLAHHQDVGGRSPGSIPTNSREIFEEGLIIPPIRLYRNGEPDKQLVRLLTRNVRLPDLLLGDLKAQMAAAHVVQRGVEKICADYGKSFYFAAARQLLDHAERMTAASLAGLPEGEYTFDDYLDNDGIDFDRPIKIQARVTIRQGTIKVDFTGSSPQVAGPFNAVPSGVYSAVYFVVRAISDPAIPNNSGCYRPITLVLPDASVVNPEWPAPVASRAVTVRRIVDTLFGALIGIIPDRVTAASNGHPIMLSFGGVDPKTGNRYVMTETGTGGMGARATVDGIDCIQTDASNAMNVPVEAIETDYPIRILEYRLRRDSGGAGKWRGGLGYKKVYQLLRGEARVSHRGERHFFAPWGVYGGRAGKKSVSYVMRSNGAKEPIRSKGELVLHEGDAVHTLTTGGGGYGDPLERPIESVVADFKEGRLSIAAAEREYGVAIEPVTGRIDAGRTTTLRSSRSSLHSGTLFDRGEEGDS